jgi:hypothetical protein
MKKNQNTLSYSIFPPFFPANTAAQILNELSLQDLGRLMFVNRATKAIADSEWRIQLIRQLEYFFPTDPKQFLNIDFNNCLHNQELVQWFQQLPDAFWPALEEYIGNIDQSSDDKDNEIKSYRKVLMLTVLLFLALFNNNIKILKFYLTCRFWEWCFGDVADDDEDKRMAFIEKFMEEFMSKLSDVLNKVASDFSLMKYSLMIKHGLLNTAAVHDRISNGHIRASGTLLAAVRKGDLNMVQNILETEEFWETSSPHFTAEDDPSHSSGYLNDKAINKIAMNILIFGTPNAQQISAVSVLIPYATEKTKTNILRESSSRGYLPIVQRVLESGITITLNFLFEILESATKYPPVISELLNKLSLTDTQRDCLLGDAAGRGLLPVVQILLNCNISQFSIEGAAKRASYFGHWLIVHEFLKHPLSDHCKGHILTCALETGNSDMIRKVLNIGFEKDEEIVNIFSRFLFDEYFGQIDDQIDQLAKQVPWEQISWSIKRKILQEPYNWYKTNKYKTAVRFLFSAGYLSKSDEALLYSDYQKKMPIQLAIFQIRQEELNTLLHRIRTSTATLREKIQELEKAKYIPLFNVHCSWGSQYSLCRSGLPSPQKAIQQEIDHLQTQIACQNTQPTRTIKLQR